MRDSNILASLKPNKKIWPKIRNLVKKRVPIITWLPHYTLSTLLQDFLAGLTVGVTEIPQGIAYAAVAGLPPEYGLYSGLADGFIYAIFGSCKDVNVGPSSILSLLIFSSVLKGGPDVAILMTFLSGVIVIILGILQLGFVINFFSIPTMSGFIDSGVVLIGLSQFLKLLGITGNTDSFVETCKTLVNQIHQARLWDTTLGISSFVFLLLFKYIQTYGTLQTRPDWSKLRNFFGKIIFILSLARSFLVLIVGTSLAYYYRNDQPFTITGQVSAGFPTFRTPPFSTTFNGTNLNFSDIMSIYRVSIVFLPLMIILEALTLAKVFNIGKKVDATQEMIAVGLCNLVGSFIGSMPVTGSFSRSTVNNASGVRTTFAGVFTSILLLLSIAFFTSTFYYVPKATLAAILLGAIIFLVDFKLPILLWKNNKLDLIPLVTTFITGIFLGVDYGILIGGAVNILFVLYPNARPKFETRKEISLDYQNDVFVITPRDTLYFPAAEFLRDTVLKCENNVIVVINGKYIQSMDITVAKSIAVLVQELSFKGQKIFLVDFKQSVKKVCIGLDKKMRDYFFDEEQCENAINILPQDLAVITQHPSPK